MCVCVGGGAWRGRTPFSHLKKGKQLPFALGRKKRRKWGDPRSGSKNLLRRNWGKGQMLGEPRECF